MMLKIKRWLLLSFVVVAGGCDGLGTDAVSPDYVIESYLIANEPFRRVLVSRTTSLDSAYDFSELAVRDADVQIDRLGPNDEVLETVPFVLTGVYYRPEDANKVVQPGERYRLQVTAANGDLITAETTVPGSFDVLSTSADSVQYQGPIQIDVRVSRSQYRDRQAIYVFSIESLDPVEENLTSFYREFIEEGDDLEQLRITESPPINEGNYDVAGDGSLTIGLPWIAIAFLGPNNVIANAIDDNLYDFIRSQSVQQGGSTFSPGEIPNVISSVSGGTGVFGSLSRTSFRAYFWE